jgi:chemotaxis protein MotB
VRETAVAKSKGHEAAIIKRGGRKHEEEEHGGSWKVAFADFCLALMCLYLVLWVLAARQTEEAQASLQNASSSLLDQGKGRLSETMGGPRGSLISREPLPRHNEAVPSRKTGSGPDYPDEIGKPTGKSRVRYESPEDLRDLAKVLGRMSEQGGLKANLQTVITPYGLRVMLHDTEHEGMFQLGSAVPTTRFRDLLMKMGPLFAQMANQMLVIGHTDGVPFADPSHHGASNWTLSSSRAAAARGLLLDGGMPEGSVLQVVGMADQALLDSSNPLASENRRIELVILTKAQADSVVAMYGQPDTSAGEPPREILPDVEAVLPGPGPLAALREQLRAIGQKLRGATDTTRP